jgi:BirA family transcriptional regulator, biotin operon repressor / biotin---[acetyl-CoA-carboxylase] ligase
MKTLFIGQHLIELKTVDSTNNYAKELIGRGEAVEGTLIVAETQQQGRGQRENSWESEPGKNLTFSLVLEPKTLSVQLQFILSKCISLSLYKFLKALTSLDVYIKWPNDILIDGKKVAGILIENIVVSGMIKHSIVGIGINVNQEKFEKTAHAASIFMLNHKTYDLNFLLTTLCNFIESQYLLLKNNSFEAIDKDYMHALFRYNEVASYFYMGNTIEAAIIGIDSYGKLILQRTSGELITCGFKEIAFVL